MARHVVIGAGVLGALALVAGAAQVWPGGDGQVDGPVIALGDGWNGYPTSIVSGSLTLVDGCLLLGDEVVFWPRGTTWDEDARAVAFGGAFDDAPDAVVGEEFTGGGGHYSVANVYGLPSLDADVVRQCVEATGAAGVVVAVPDL